MSKYFALLLLLLSGCHAVYWPTNEFIKKNHYKEVFGNENRLVFDSSKCNNNIRYPQYPKGIIGLYAYLNKNLESPITINGLRYYGKLYISFVVGLDGYVEDVEIIHLTNQEKPEEVLKVIKSMKRWIPGACDDKFVKSKYVLPLKFSKE